MNPIHKYLKLKSLLLAFLIYLVCVPATWAVEVGVIIDTSISMRKTDREQYAILATKILVDLLDPSKDDLFVLFFNNRYKNAKDTNPHKVIRWNPLKYGSTPGDYTSSVHREINNHSRYDAHCTYFAPSIREALKNFNGQWGQKLLIVLTDGQTNDIEKDRGCAHSSGLHERSIFDGDINTLILKEHVKVAPLLLSKKLKKRVRTQLLQSYFLTFFDQSGRGGEPLQEVKKAEDLPCKFAELLSKTSTKTVQCLGQLKSAPKRNLQGQRSHSFEVDPAMSRADVISVVSKVFLKGPKSGGTPDILLVPPAPNPPTWTPLKGDFSIGRHQSYYGRGVQKNSSYSVLRVKGAGPGQSPKTGYWNVYKNSTFRYRPSSFVVKYYDFDISLKTQSTRLSIPLNQPICFESILTNRNATKPMPIKEPNVLSNIEIAFYSKFEKTLGQNAKPGAPPIKVIGKPLKVKDKLLDDGNITQGDIATGDAHFNGCVKLTANDLGLTYEEVKASNEILGRMVAQVSVIYNGEPRVQSDELSIDILPPMKLTQDGGGIVELFGPESRGLGLGEEVCEKFIFSESNSKIPKIGGTAYDRFRVYLDGLAQIHLKNKPSLIPNPQADPVFDKLRVKICKPSQEDPKQCHQTLSSANGAKLTFPDIPATVYSFQEKKYENLVDLELNSSYLVCASAGFRYDKVDSPDPKSSNQRPLKLIFTPDDGDYRDRHDKTKSLPTISPNGPKWEIEGEVKLHVRLRKPTLWEKYWSFIVLLTLFALLIYYFYQRKRKLRLPNDLTCQVWSEGEAREAALLIRIPSKNSYLIKAIGLELSTTELSLNTGEGLVATPSPGVTIKERDQYGSFRKVQEHERYKLWITIDRVYESRNSQGDEKYFTLKYGS